MLAYKYNRFIWNFLSNSYNRISIIKNDKAFKLTEIRINKQTFANFLSKQSSYVISYCVRPKIPPFLKAWDPSAGRWTRVVHVSRTWARHIYSRTILCHPCARCDWIFRGICFRRRFFVYLFQWRGNKQLLEKTTVTTMAENESYLIVVLEEFTFILFYILECHKKYMNYISILNNIKHTD